MESDPGRARGHGRASAENVRPGGRRPSEDISPSRQPVCAKFSYNIHTKLACGSAALNTRM